MKILQIGAGSMGRRRLRDLGAQTEVRLGVFDLSEQRMASAQRDFGVVTFSTFIDALKWQPEAMIISTPPDRHAEYVELALDRGIHHFCEENIWTYNHRMVERISQERSLVSVPSCSYHFLPMVAELKRVRQKELGALHAYQMTLSTYMPGWHPDEGPEFYARRRSTAAAREMVPFELVWLNHVFGPPSQVSGTVARNGMLDGDSEDTWTANMDIEGGGQGQLLVMHACPVNCRAGRAFGANGWIEFDLLTGILRRRLKAIDIDDERDVGGHVRCVEQAYYEEINTFIEVVRKRKQWPHSYFHSAIATGTLAAAEEAAISSQRTKVNPDNQPLHVPDDKFFLRQSGLTISG